MKYPLYLAPLAQGIEQRSSKPLVAGSNPAGGTLADEKGTGCGAQPVPFCLIARPNSVCIPGTNAVHGLQLLYPSHERCTRPTESVSLAQTLYTAYGCCILRTNAVYGVQNLYPSHERCTPPPSLPRGRGGVDHSWTFRLYTHHHPPRQQFPPQNGEGATLGVGSIPPETRPATAPGRVAPPGAGPPAVGRADESSFRLFRQTFFEAQ